MFAGDIDRGQGAILLGMIGRSFKLWWTRTGDGVGSVGVKVKELCGKVVEVRMVSDD